MISVQKSVAKTSDRLPQIEQGVNERAVRHASLNPVLELQQTIGNQAVLQLLRSGTIQAKLAINQPGDPAEQEADLVADQVMRMAHPRVQRACVGCTADSIPCPECKEERKVQRQEHAAVKPTAVSDEFAARLGAGRQLEPDVRAFFEPRFGQDFGDVRVHADSQSDASARSVDALAFTVGRHVAFRAGHYSPWTQTGRRLLGHELAHVVQQGSAPHPSTIFRAATDFRIRGKFADSASFPNLVFFDEGSLTFDAAEKAKIAVFALPASDMLTLNGFGSEEGSAAANLSTVNARLAAVATELVAKGHDAAKISKVPLPSSGEGRIAYRRMRSVEILKPGVASAVPSAVAAATAPCAGSNETNFMDAEAEAETMIAKSVTALTAPIPGAMTALLTRFFPGWAPADAATINSNLSNIKTQLHRLRPVANHQCAIIKHATCEAGAEAENTNSGAAAMMTMCPTFFGAGKTKKGRAGTLIHEASHGTPGLVTKDKAYAHERLIEFLSLPDALKNSDSYVLLVRLFDTPGSVTVGPATPDPLAGGIVPGTAEEKAARQTIAWMEKWLIWSYQEMSSLYGTIHRSIAAGAWTNPYYRDTMGLVAPLFGLSAPPALPTKTDKVKVAAVHDRLHIMRFTEKGRAITLNKVPGGADTWAPGPGTSVNLTPAFFADSPRGRLDRMLTAIAKATPDVSSPFVAKYVALADKIRTHMGGGAP